MKKITILIVSSVSIVMLLVLILRPVPIVFENKAIVEKGVVLNIYKTKGNDIFFKLENNPRRFYINRGVEEGLQLIDLREKLIGNKIVLKYSNYWTPLDWNDSIKHISKVEFNDEIVFNELK